MSAAFTPAPWNIQNDGQIWCDDHPVCEVTDGKWGDWGRDILTGEVSLVHHWGTVAPETAEANRHLIAAAPAMFEALRLHVAYEATPADRGGKNGPKGKAWTAFIDARDTALNQARGQ